MCPTTIKIAPTKESVYLRKTTKSKSEVGKSATRYVVSGSSDHKECKKCAGDSDDYLVFRCDSSGSKKKKDTKQVKHSHVSGSDGQSGETMWRFRCEAEGEKREKTHKNKVLRFAAKAADCCHCDGGDNDGWLCDLCRTIEKKSSIWKFVARQSGSNSGSDRCDCCECNPEGDRDQQRFAEECEAWMKSAAKKRKAEVKGRHSCSCHRPGCEVCVIVNC